MQRLARPFANRRFRRVVWLVVGALGWLGVMLLGVALLAQRPPRAGFDLSLILEAGRRVAAGMSPYLTGAVTTGTQAEDLFYSYPPPVAQAAALVGWLPNASVLVLAGLAAVVGFATVVGALARERAADSGAASVIDVVLPALALAPFAYPFAIALLFGNLDLTFPAAYGSVLIAVTRPSARWWLAGGIGLGLISIAKLHPAGLLVWLAFRGVREWRRGEARRSLIVLAAALGTIGLLVAVSLIVGGTRPWSDYAAVLRAGTGAALASTLNIGPASQIALIVSDPGLVPRLAPIVSVLALAVTAGAAHAVRSTIVSFAVAATASLVLSPITWFHYPVVELPIAVAAWVTVRGTASADVVAALIVAALFVAALAVAAPVLAWLAVALVLAACVPSVRAAPVH